MHKNLLIAVGITILFLGVVVTPMTLGYDIETSKEQPDTDRYLYPEYYDCYSVDEIDGYVEYQDTDVSNDYEPAESPKPLDGPPMDSPWPMYCHDIRHTGRSPYSTIDTSNTEKWKFWTETNGIPGGIAISQDGTIYFVGSYDLYALHSNGTQKWRYGHFGVVFSCPAIDENGIIYVGKSYNWDGLYAFYPNGTIKWRYKSGAIYSSPAIGDDGTIYFGTEDNNNPPKGSIYALYPNGTLRWRFRTLNHVVYSSPVIGEDGTIYCGSHDTYLYALYPNNGTLKWKYKTGHWIRVSPCIADDGTIYVVSLDNHLHAVNLNGTSKWKTNMGEGGTSPTIGQDGTIYCGYTKLIAINPNNGTIKWKFPVGGKIRGATPCNSIDGAIYLGNSDGSDIVAVNPDGTEKWRKSIGGDVESPPAIGEDGTVYIGSQLLNGGYLHAFGTLDSDAPSLPDIDGPNKGRAETELSFTFQSTSPLGRDVYYTIEWGDGKKKNWIGPYSSGEEIMVNHTWSKRGTYTIKARAKDTDNLWGPWSYFDVDIPRNRATTYLWYQWFLDRHPLLERLLGWIR